MNAQFLLCLLSCFCTALLHAQTVVVPPGVALLTLKEAEALALKNNPRISTAKLLALAQGQVVTEVRSAELPNAYGSLTAVDPHAGSRITAGALNNPIIYQRAAGGVTVSQLITDFGRTRNLVASEQWREKATALQQQATAADVILAVDSAFYNALGAQAELEVAQQTVTTRQTTLDQISALAKAKLKSDLDSSFAGVNLAQAKLLLLDAGNHKDAAQAALNAILGSETQQRYTLVDERTSEQDLTPPPASGDELLDLAFRSRPDLIALQDQWESEERFRRAEHDLLRPTISALAVVGGTPVRVPEITSSWYGAAGVNVNIPIFNGFQYSARAKEADYRTEAIRQQMRELRDLIARDVETTRLQAQTSFQRLAVAAQLLQQANQALELAQARYKLGLGSIVELSQAQLQQTDAAIGGATARFDYLSALASLRYQTGQ